MQMWWYCWQDVRIIVTDISSHNRISDYHHPDLSTQGRWTAGWTRAPATRKYAKCPVLTQCFMLLPSRTVWWDSYSSTDSGEGWAHWDWPEGWKTPEKHHVMNVSQSLYPDLGHLCDHVGVQGEPLQLGQAWAGPALVRVRYLYQTKTKLW